MVLEHINKIPPFICIAMARENGKSIKHEDIASRAGVHVNTISRLSGKTKWDGYSIEIIDSVSTACGVDLNNQRDAWAYLKKTMKAKKKFNHLGKKAREKVGTLILKWKKEKEESSEGDGDDAVV